MDVGSLFGVGVGSDSVLKPGALGRQHLLELRVLGQVSNKFILAVSGSAGARGGLLVALDQHAADERVQLEDMHAEAFGSSFGCVDAERGFPSAPVLLPTELTLSESEAAALRTYEARVRHWGWDWKVSARAGAGAGGGREAATTIAITRVPMLLGMKVLGALPFHQYLLEVLDVGGALRPPTSFLNLLASKSCRQAIMFGDELCLETMREVARRLAGTKLPFMCAHGRPTAAPVLDISAARGAAASLREAAPSASRPTGRRLARMRAVMDGLRVRFDAPA